jgi:hypothetical protein
MSEQTPKEVFKIEKLTKERIESEKYQVSLKEKRFFYYTIIVFIGLFISALMFDYYLDKEETTDKIIVDTLGEEYPKISTPIYFLGEPSDEFLPLFKHYHMEEKSLSDSLDISTPSIFVLNAEADLLEDRIIIDLLKARHVVFFIGTNMDPLKILPLFSEFEIPFVPVEGTLPTYFQGYGAMYSIKSETVIPIFAASNSKDSLDLRSIANSFSVFNEHIAKKENTNK